MKTGVFPALCGLILFLTSSAIFAQSTAPALYVTVKTVEVKASFGFFSRVLGTLAFGDTVTVQQSQGKWLVVRSASGLQGWAPADAFSTRRIISGGSSVSASEFALAGKGFNDDLEKVLRSSGDIDYKGVDAMEKRKIAPEELRIFLKEGRLAEGE